MKREIMALSAALSIAIQALAGAHYATVHNAFASIEHIEGMTSIENDYLICNNATAQNTILTDTTRIATDKYRFQARLANEHNSSRHSYRVADSNGNKRNIQAPTWGIAFDINHDKSDYWAITMQCLDTDINNDISNHRYARFALIHFSGGNASIIATKDIDKGISLNSGFNSIEVQVNSDEIKVLAGDDQLSTIMQVERKVSTTAPRRAGCYIGAGAKVRIERAVIDFEHDNSIYLDTGWTIDSLKQHFEASIDPIEGFWHYLDRDMEDRWLRLGGRYTLAIVKNGTHYDIIYIDGAKTRSDLWHTGQLKARLTPTIFSNHFDLMWVDATHQPITQDAYGTIENGVMLTLKFPIYKSQFRLSKILTP